MNTFLQKLAMLAMFVLAVVCGWSALYMEFAATLWNLLLGILAAFFMFRALELVDKLNHFGPHADSENNNAPSVPGPRNEERDAESTPDEDKEN